MKKQQTISRHIGITLTLFFLYPFIGVTGTVTVTFKSLKQYQQLCFKSPVKFQCRIKQIHPRQVLLSFNSATVINKGKNIPNFIVLTSVKGDTKKHSINFGKPYKVAEFYKDGALYLDLHPSESATFIQPASAIPIQTDPPNKSAAPIAPMKPIELELLADSLTISKSNAEEALVLEKKSSFPLASFVQGKKIYILWPSSTLLSSKVVPLIPGINKIEWLKQDNKVIGMLISIKPFSQLSVCKDKERWILGLKKNPFKENYNWGISTDTQGRSSCIIEDVQSEKVENFIDPLTGEFLYVAHSYNDRRKLDSPIEMVEMKILPSMVGIICQPYQKNLELRCENKNLILSTPSGLTLSPEEERCRDVPYNRRNFFKFYSFKSDKKSWVDQRNLLIAGLNSPKWEQGLQRYFDLIRFYISTGFSEEAFSFLQKVIQKDPFQKESETYLGLLAVTQVFRNHYEDALTIFKDARFMEEKEIDLWVALTQLCLGQNISDLSIFTENLEFLKSYPSIIKMKFVVAATSYFLKIQKIDQAKKMLELITQADFENGVTDEYQYLQSLIMYKENKKEQAVKVWEELSKDFKTRIGLEANLLLLDHQIALGTLKTDAIIKQLKSLRYRWRDDEIELRIVNRLIDYYLMQKQYRLALTEMKYLENNFSALIDAQEMRRKIQEQLIKIYTQKTENFSLLNSLGLYNDYKNYFPKDDRMKNIRMSLAENLLAIGLTDQGIQILNDQLKEASASEQAIIGTKIAETYIKNETPRAALQVLKETTNSTISSETLAKRQMIEARSLALLQKYDEALSIIQHRIDKDGLLLKCDILLTANRWVEAGEILHEFLEKEKIEKDVLNSQQSQLILDLAVTAALSKKYPLLNNLRLRYLDLMKKTDLASLFDLVTKKPDPISAVSEATIERSLEKTEEFQILLTAYKVRLKKDLKE